MVKFADASGIDHFLYVYDLEANIIVHQERVKEWAFLIKAEGCDGRFYSYTLTTWKSSSINHNNSVDEWTVDLETGKLTQTCVCTFSFRPHLCLATPTQLFLCDIGTRNSFGVYNMQDDPTDLKTLDFPMNACVEEISLVQREFSWSLQYAR